MLKLHYISIFQTVKLSLIRSCLHFKCWSFKTGYILAIQIILKDYVVLKYDEFSKNIRFLSVR